MTVKLDEKHKVTQDEKKFFIPVPEGEYYLKILPLPDSNSGNIGTSIGSVDFSYFNTNIESEFYNNKKTIADLDSSDLIKIKAGEISKPINLITGFDFEVSSNQEIEKAKTEMSEEKIESASGCGLIKQ